jgi:predicted nucleic acid-binding protein
MPTALIDTSVLIDLDQPGVAAQIPADVAISALTLAELGTGPALADTPTEARTRQTRLQQVEASFEPLPFDTRAARSYAHVVTAVTSQGRSHRSRVLDLLIAATAHANSLPLYTRNPDDFTGLESLVEVIAV